MAPPEIEYIATEAAKKAVRETLLMMGVDVADPKSLLELQKDHAYTRDSRLATAAIRTRAYLVVTGTVVTGILTAIYMALRGNGH